MSRAPHTPVLLNEILEGLSDLDMKEFIDGTLGAGGHAKALLEAHPEICHLYGLDKDKEALELAAQNLQPFGDKIRLIHSGFENMGDLFVKNSMDGILLDLGVSSMQLDQASRGFSFQGEGPLDMRMDKSASFSAKTLINSYSEADLGRIFSEYGEERQWRKAAKAVVFARQKRKIETTAELVNILMPVLSPGGGRGRIHPATRIFQALRIEVNDELNVLKKGIESALTLLRKNGRLLVISFHSLEDRIVKYAFRDFVSAKILTKKPKQATLEEMRKNARSRSAKLRILEKIL